MKISVIVPVYNERDTIAAVLDQLLQVPLDLEVLVVDDGSTDGTVEALIPYQDLVRCHRLAVNGGKGAAIRAGIQLVLGDVMVIQDADLELSPAALTSLVAPVADGSLDAVYGSRFLNGGAGVRWSRRAANRLLTGLTNLIYGTRLTDMETAHKAIRLDVVRTLELESDRFEIEVELTAKLARSGVRIGEVHSPYSPRTKEEGKKIRWRDGLTALVTLWRYRRWSPVAE